MTQREPTLSNRLLWPFSRVVGTDARAIAVLSEMGLSPIDLAEGDRRSEARLVLRGLQSLVDAFGDPLLGLRAGSLVEEGTMDVLEYAARSTATLRDALQVISRYVRVMIESEAWLDDESAPPAWCYAPTVPHPAAANDFVIALGLTFARRNCEIYAPPAEIWLMHERPGYADAYAEYFAAPVRFGAPHNAVVLHPIALETPMRARNSEMAVAFERKAHELAQSLISVGSVTRRVREALAAQFASGSVQMSDTARRLGMGVATLRRKLEAEGASFSDILDDMRKEAALRYLRQPEPSVSDIAFMLGFSDVRAFGRAFKRWTGASPSDFRQAQSAARTSR